jgi:2,3-bisphosphoglycerate-independent phosphoglycerate mutase
MKYILLVPDGMADEPQPDLNGRTPLQAARTPYFDELAAHGQVGSVQVTPLDMYPGSDAANMALLGYDPVKHYTGRGPVEAAAMGIHLAGRDVAFRCSLVSTDGSRMVDYSSGHITTEEARPLLSACEKLLSGSMRLFPGVAYRHILLWPDGPTEVLTHAPHENMGRVLEEILPTGEQENRIRQLIWDSYELLDAHPFNRRRKDEGRLAANTLWPWSQGRSPSLAPFSSRRGCTGAVVAGVDVIRGLGTLAGLEVLHVPGATGGLDTDYAAKGRAAADALLRHDFVWLHVEAPDEAGHMGSIEEKIKAIECTDRLALGTLLNAVQGRHAFRILIVPDHATPVRTRGHSIGPVPFLLYDSRTADTSSSIPFDERALHERVTHIEEGHRLLDKLFV